MGSQRDEAIRNALGCSTFATNSDLAYWGDDGCDREGGDVDADEARSPSSAAARASETSTAVFLCCSRSALDSSLLKINYMLQVKWKRNTYTSHLQGEMVIKKYCIVW